MRDHNYTQELDEVRRLVVELGPRAKEYEKNFFFDQKTFEEIFSELTKLGFRLRLNRWLAHLYLYCGFFITMTICLLSIPSPGTTVNTYFYVLSQIIYFLPILIGLYLSVFHIGRKIQFIDVKVKENLEKIRKFKEHVNLLSEDSRLDEASLNNQLMRLSARFVNAEKAFDKSMASGDRWTLIRCGKELEQVSTELDRFIDISGLFGFRFDKGGSIDNARPKSS